MALASGSVTIKLSGGSYSTWAAFWADLANMTGDITCTVDASAFTEAAAMAIATENLATHVLTVTAATFPTTTDATTGPRFTCNFAENFCDLSMEGAGTITIQGMTMIEGSDVPAVALFIDNVATGCTINFLRNIIKGGESGLCPSTDSCTYNFYNNIIYNQAGDTARGILTWTTPTGHFSNNTVVDVSGATTGHGIDGDGDTGTYENNLVYNSKTLDFYQVASATGSNNSSHDATADDFGAGANNRINKTTSPFTNYAADDFTLAAASDPVGNGKDLSAKFTKDFFGVTRATWDIGACYLAAVTTLSINVSECTNIKDVA